MADIEKLKDIATQVRRDVIRMIADAASGHPGGALGCADYFVALYFEVLRHDPKYFRMDGKGQDVFFLSNGHISAVWYSVLARSGYFPLKELATFRKIDSRLQGHPATAEGLPGVRIASGSLGQGLSAAVGMALAKKMDNDPYLVYVLMGDGEIEEGQIWEAAMFAAAKNVDNIIATIDYNDKQIDGPVHEVLYQGDLEAKWRAFGWDVLHADGNDMQDIVNTLYQAKERTGKGKPVMILMRTVMGKGVDFMEDDHNWHGKPPTQEQKEIALQQLPETLGDY